MSAIDVKLIAQCLASLRDLELATISDLAESTGLSRPTVTAALTAMTDSGLAVEHEAREQFKYKGAAVFGPHFDIERLVTLAGNPAAQDVRQEPAA